MFDNCNYRTLVFQTKNGGFAASVLTCSMLLIQLNQFCDFAFVGGDGRFNGSRGMVDFYHDTAPGRNCERRLLYTHYIPMKYQVGHTGQ